VSSPPLHHAVEKGDHASPQNRRRRRGRHSRRDRGQPRVSRVSPALAATGWTILAAPPTGQNAGFTAVTTASESNGWAVRSENAELNRVGAKILIDDRNGTV
jgi:hypothetical protein